MIKKKNIKFNINKKIYYIYGNDLYKKHKYKLLIKKYLESKINNCTTINIVVHKKKKWKYIYEKIFFENCFFKKKIIILNFIEKIEKLTELIKKNIFNKLYFKKNKYIYLILNIEFTYYLSSLELYKFKKLNIIFIKCNKNIYNNKNIFYKTIEKKYKNNKLIKSWINSFKKKKIHKNFIIFKKIQKNNLNKLIILNILFKYIKKNINQFNNKKIIKILKIIKKCEINIKKGINISWINFNIINIYILK